MCASPCSVNYSGYRLLRNIEALTPLFTDHVSMRDNPNIKSLTENVAYVLYKACSGVNIGPMGKPLRKRESTDKY